MRDSFFIYMNMLNYDDYIFEQKLNMLLNNINEKQISDNEYVWDNHEYIWDNIDNNISTYTKIKNIANTLPNKFKNILNILLNNTTKITKNITKKQSNMLLNKITEKIYKLTDDINIRKKIMYITIIFLISITPLSITEISIDNKNIESEIIPLIEKIPQRKKKEKELTSTKSLNEFLKKLAFKESSNKWNTIKYTHRKNRKVPVYVGKYQFGNLAFRDIKSKIRVKDFVKNPDIWPEHQQDKDIIKLLKNNKYYLRKSKSFPGYEHYIGKTINGVDITESGILAAAHLVGNKNVKKFLISNGKIDPADGNNTKCSTYMNEFKNFHLPI